MPQDWVFSPASSDYKASQMRKCAQRKAQSATRKSQAGRQSTGIGAVGPSCPPSAIKRTRVKLAASQLVSVPLGLLAHRGSYKYKSQAGRQYTCRCRWAFLPSVGQIPHSS